MQKPHDGPMTVPMSVPLLGGRQDRQNQAAAEAMVKVRHLETAARIYANGAASMLLQMPEDEPFPLEELRAYAHVCKLAALPLMEAFDLVQVECRPTNPSPPGQPQSHVPDFEDDEKEVQKAIKPFIVQD